MAFPVRFYGTQAAASPGLQGDGGFRFASLLSQDEAVARFLFGNRLIFVKVIGEPLTAIRYLARLTNTDGQPVLQLKNGEALLQFPVLKTVSEAAQRSVRGRSVGEGTASSEFARNRLDCDESRAQSFFADLFECRFDDPAFEEQLEIFNACAAPPSFRTVIPWEWQNMRGYLDVTIIANRLASYRLRIRSESIDALIDIDPNFRRATVRSFNGTRFSAAELKTLSTLSDYFIREGESLLPTAAAVGKSVGMVDEWM